MRPTSTSPMMLIVIVSGPGRRSVSPPSRWQPKLSCAACKPAAKRASQSAVGASGKDSAIR